MRLTKKVLDGLNTMAGVVDAGGCADFLGNDYENLPPDMQRSWDNVQLALQWIWERASKEQK